MPGSVWLLKSASSRSFGSGSAVAFGFHCLEGLRSRHTRQLREELVNLVLEEYEQPTVPVDWQRPPRNQNMDRVLSEPRVRGQFPCASEDSFIHLLFLLCVPA